MWVGVMIRMVRRMLRDRIEDEIGDEIEDEIEDQIGDQMIRIRPRRSWLSTKVMYCHSMPSASYSACE